MSDRMAAFLRVGVVLLLGAIPGCMMGYDMGCKDSQLNAIRQGIAEYRINAETGKVSFHWKTNEVLPTIITE